MKGSGSVNVQGCQTRVFAFLAALGVLLDVRRLRRGGVSGAVRVARHLWRMCLALFTASASFFLGSSSFSPRGC